MKHTFVFIDKVMILLKFVPRSLNTEEDKIKAGKAINLLREYTHILRKLIFNHKTEKYLNRLHNTHIKEIENWTEQVAAVFRKMDKLLAVLDGDTKKLTHVLENEPEKRVLVGDEYITKWQLTVSDMALGMVMSGLHDEEEDMVRLRNIAIFEVHELEEIINHKKHVGRLHVWNVIAELPEEEQIINEERFFIDLFS